MFTHKELSTIDRHYFSVRSTGCHCIVVQSKNTKHIWAIQHEEIGKLKHCIIYHKHSDSEPYHLHTNAKDIESSFVKIKEHDVFQLNGRKNLRNRNLHHNL